MMLPVMIDEVKILGVEWFSQILYYQCRAAAPASVEGGADACNFKASLINLVQIARTTGNPEEH